MHKPSDIHDADRKQRGSDNMFEQITEHIHVYPCDGHTDRPNVGLIIGSKYTLLFDAGNSETHVEMMKHDMQKQDLHPVNAIVLSHWHWDHSFGAHAWNVPVIAGRETNVQLQIVQKWE